MKGIILAGGMGTRLYPLTTSISKQILPVYDKPMIYYPLSTLMLSGIQDILVISNPENIPPFQKLLGSGEQWGIHFSYAEQEYPRGLADAFLVGEAFIAGEPVVLILGDNIFYGSSLVDKLNMAVQQARNSAVIFAYPVRDPERFGVIELDKNDKPVSIVEKPRRPKSNYAIPGIYFYDHQVVPLAKSLKPSNSRNELEITDLNRLYLEKQQLEVITLGRGIAWLDAGTHEALLQAANFVQTVENRQGLMISCPEEIAYRMGYITASELKHLAGKIGKNEYGQYLLHILDEKVE